MKIGFGTFCSDAHSRMSTNHTVRLQNLNFDRLFKAFLMNLDDLFKLLDLCKSENIQVFRLGSSFIPFASHDNFEERWLYKLEPLLMDAGKRIRREYNIRMTMHPGQFVVLNSPNKDVVDRSLRELQYHFWLLDRLGIGEDGVVVVHVDGVYEAKQRAIDKFIDTVEKNSWLKRRLAVENDENLFNARDVLQISQTLKIPFVFDYFHHTLNHSEISLKEVFDTWSSARTPKVHLSSGREDELGLHGDYIRVEDFINLWKILSQTGIDKIHIMIEAKKKELAIRRLREELTKLPPSEDAILKTTL